MTIIMVIYNELESVKLAVESVRLFADIEDLSLVVVDNHSVDATDKWAKAQEDITYIYMDEGELPFGQALNRVRTLLQIDDDLLIMDALMLAPQTLSRLQELLYREETVGAVGEYPTVLCLIRTVRSQRTMRWLSDGRRAKGRCRRREDWCWGCRRALFF